MNESETLPHSEAILAGHPPLNLDKVRTITESRLLWSEKIMI